MDAVFGVTAFGTAGFAGRPVFALVMVGMTLMPPVVAVAGTYGTLPFAAVAFALFALVILESTEGAVLWNGDTVVFGGV